jgi:hypothetical protein
MRVKQNVKKVTKKFSVKMDPRNKREKPEIQL